METKFEHVNRRDFLKTGATVAAAATVGETNGAEAGTSPQTQSRGMPVRQLPRGGRTMPLFGLGTATMMDEYDPRPHAEKVATVRHAYEQGVRYFDTAAVYKTAPLVGDALHDVRDDIYINTKTMAPTRAAARKDVEQALRELKTDVIDCVKVHLPHDYDRAMTLLDELDVLRKEGKIRLVGMSNHVHFEVAYKLIDTGRLDEILIARGYFPKGEVEIIVPRNAEVREMCISRAQELGMNIIGMKALGGFVYSAMRGMWVPDFDPEKGKKLPAAAIRWALSDSRFHVFIIGCERKEQIDENIRLCSGDIAPTAEDRIVLAEFTAKAMDSDMMKKCPVPYADPNSTDEMPRILAGRKVVMEEVLKYNAKLWATPPTG